jgi:hypothetical protein
MVSLGVRVNLSDLDLEKGDKISVSGKKTAASAGEAAV